MQRFFYQQERFMYSQYLVRREPSYDYRVCSSVQIFSEIEEITQGGTWSTTRPWSGEVSQSRPFDVIGFKRTFNTSALSEVLSVLGAASKEELRFWVCLFLAENRDRNSFIGSNSKKYGHFVRGLTQHGEDLSRPLDKDRIKQRLLEVFKEIDGKYSNPTYNSFERSMLYSTQRRALMNLGTCLHHLFGATEALRMICESFGFGRIFYFLFNFGPINPNEHEEAKEVLFESMRKFSQHTNIKERPAVLALAAALFPDEDLIENHLLPAWDRGLDRPYKLKGEEVVSMVLGHPDVDRMWEILKGRVADFEPWQLRIILRRLGPEKGVDVLRTLGKRTHNKTRHLLLPEAMMMHNPAMAQPMLGMMEDAVSGGMVKAWLVGEGANAVEGVLSEVGRSKKWRAQGFEVLRQVASTASGRELVEECLAGHKASTQALVKEHVLEFEAEHQPWPKSQWPEWVNSVGAMSHELKAEWESLSPRTLPAVLSRGGDFVMTPPMQDALAACVVASTDAWDEGEEVNEALDSRLMQIREDLDLVSLDAWARAMFERREAMRNDAEGALPIDWVFVLGALCCREANLEDLGKRSLSPWIAYDGDWRKWGPLTARFLGYNGTPTAYQVLLLIIEKSKRVALQKDAQREKERLCKARGWLLEDFDDLAVPTGGMNEEGGYPISYGEREFELRFQAPDQVVVVDSSGGRLSKMPVVKKSDDAAAVKRAKSDYKRLKKLCKKLGEERASKLEEQMWENRIWGASSWRDIFWKHPIMRLLAQGVVWQIEHAEGEWEEALLQSDGSWMNLSYDHVILVEGARLRVCHPMELVGKKREAWSMMMGEFEVIESFAQLGVEVHDLDWIKGQGKALVEAMRKNQTLNLREDVRDLGWGAERYGSWDKNDGFWRPSKEGYIAVLFGVGNFWTSIKSLPREKSLYFPNHDVPKRGIVLGEDVTPKNKEEARLWAFEGADKYEVALVGRFVQQLWDVLGHF